MNEKSTFEISIPFIVNFVTALKLLLAFGLLNLKIWSKLEKKDFQIGFIDFFIVKNATWKWKRGH